MPKEMQIKYLPTDSLIPYDRNPRRNDDAVKAVMESIRQVGIRVPVVIDSKHVIVAGDTRYKAIKALRIAEVPCIIAEDLTPAQIKAFRLADNKTQELSRWDFTKLDKELMTLQPLFDLAPFGFSLTRASNEQDKASKSDDQDNSMVTCPRCHCEFCRHGGD